MKRRAPGPESELCHFYDGSAVLPLTRRQQPLVSTKATKSNQMVCIASQNFMKHEEAALVFIFKI